MNMSEIFKIILLIQFVLIALVVIGIGCYSFITMTNGFDFTLWTESSRGSLTVGYIAASVIVSGVFLEDVI